MNGFNAKTVLVPVDFSKNSHQAVDAALEFFAGDATVHVIHVAADLMVVEPGLVWEEMSEKVREKNVIAAFEKEYADDKYRRVQFHVAFGDAGHHIADFAEEIKAGLIVMPSHGRTGLTRMLIGSVAERVVRLAHCPVMVLKHSR